MRFYRDGDSYENRDRYIGLCTVQHMGSAAFVSAAHGEVTKKHWLSMFSRLRDLGVEKVYTERKGRMKVYTIGDYI